MPTKDGRFCPSCSFAIRDGAKFCPNCGAKAPEISKPQAESVNVAEVREWLLRRSNDEEDDIYTIEIEVDERSQLVFVGVYEDQDGESEYDHVTVWSIFASVDDVPLKDALSAVRSASFGMKRLGDNYVLYTSARVEDLASVDALIQLVYWLGAQADVRERELLGSDEY